MEEVEGMVDEETDYKLQQLYVNSHYIPNKFKLVILRKLFKANLSTGGSFITLGDMRDLILLA